MRTVEITPQEFLKGQAVCQHLKQGRHTYRARLEGRSVIVEDEHGQRVDVKFAASGDMRTCYAHVDGVGFIGGWQHPHKRRPFTDLVDDINRGRLYSDQTLLPNGRSKFKRCPHCGKEL